MTTPVARRFEMHWSAGGGKVVLSLPMPANAAEMADIEQVVAMQLSTVRRCMAAHQADAEHAQTEEQKE